MPENRDAQEASHPGDLVFSLFAYKNAQFPANCVSKSPKYLAPERLRLLRSSLLVGAGVRIRYFLMPDASTYLPPPRPPRSSRGSARLRGGKPIIEV